MPWVRIHGGSGQVHDTRKSGQPPSDRGGAAEVWKHSSISQRRQVTLYNNPKDSTKVLRVGSTGQTILPHGTILRHSIFFWLNDTFASGSSCPIPRRHIALEKVIARTLIYGMDSTTFV